MKTTESESLQSEHSLGSSAPALKNIVQGSNSQEKIPPLQRYLDLHCVYQQRYTGIFDITE